MDVGSVGTQLARVILGPDALESAVLERLQGAGMKDEDGLSIRLQAVRQAAVQVAVMMAQGPFGGQRLLGEVAHEVWSYAAWSEAVEAEREAGTSLYLEVFEASGEESERLADRLGEAFAERCGCPGDQAYVLAGGAVFTAALSAATVVLAKEAASRCRG